MNRRQHRKFPGERGPRPDKADDRRKSAILRMNSNPRMSGVVAATLARIKNP